MYVSIRQYDDVRSMDEVVRRVDSEFTAIISEVPGFVAYYLVDAGNGRGATISIFENEEAAEESNRRAADWIRENLAQRVDSPADIMVGEVRVEKRV